VSYDEIAAACLKCQGQQCIPPDPGWMRPNGRVSPFSEFSAFGAVEPQAIIAPSLHPVWFAPFARTEGTNARLSP
jgi:hypothetical protein